MGRVGRYPPSAVVGGGVKSVPQVTLRGRDGAPARVQTEGRISFDLVANARDSLEHAVEHLTANDGRPSPGDLKRALRDVVHAAELLVKERLLRVHPAFIWRNVDDYPSSPPRTVDFTIAIHRLETVAGVKLAQDAHDVLCAGREIRNTIEHFAVEADAGRVRRLLGRLVSWVLVFSAAELGVDFEAEFRADGRWASLVELVEFWRAHADVVERRLREEGGASECPRCSADTFDEDAERCHLCGYVVPRVRCASCGEAVLRDDVNYFDLSAGQDGDEETAVCKGCQEAWAWEQLQAP